MNIRAKSIKIIFDNSSEDRWEATCAGGIEFDDVMRMIARAWKEYDEPKEPIEPLIKDKKMRQCVKLWTEINEFKGKLMYSEDDGNTEVFFLKDATATFSSFTAAPEVVKF